MQSAVSRPTTRSRTRPPSSSVLRLIGPDNSGVSITGRLTVTHDRGGDTDVDTVGPREAERPVGVAFGEIAVVEQRVMAGTDKKPVAQVRWASLGPPTLVMKVSDAAAAAGEAAVAAVSNERRSSLGGRPCPGLSAESERFAVDALHMGDGGGVARQAGRAGGV